ncbi:hypothetical protein M409DRAFT_53190 [Zasmidium cellare ATCC 36951]|uniref:Uncharacterized protein n=1 Tax=Zasmidium cellare ATCC 36951 TaxID=1080233 RepID=A0A6A6CMP1_ZASCE|nr:uncharacterized protein M409DRAFT_53190 [Zasmidium cellare ATCC 36951]KAF2168527.1 hypothetical protein M409DRAFT_53190 [Zasmidium cellare ATCC 36951]
MSFSATTKFLLREGIYGLIWLILLFRPVFTYIIHHEPVIPPHPMVRESTILFPVYACAIDFMHFCMLSFAFYFCHGLKAFQLFPEDIAAEYLWRQTDLRRGFARGFKQEHFTAFWFAFRVATRMGTAALFCHTFGAWYTPFDVLAWVMFCVDVQYVMLNVLIFLGQRVGVDVVALRTEFERYLGAFF